MHGLSTGSTIFNLGWPWTVLVNGHQNHTPNISKNGDTYDGGVNRSRIGNYPWAIDWQHDIWPWMTLNRSRSRSQDFLIKYLVYEDRYNVRHNWGQIGNPQWAFDWPLLSWMTLNWHTSRSSKLHVKYCENACDRYDDCVNWSRIGNHRCAIDWHHHELWPSMTSNPPRSRSRILQQIFQTWWQNNVVLKRGQIANHQWAFDWHYELWLRMTLNYASLDNWVGNNTHWQITFHRTYFL